MVAKLPSQKPREILHSKRGHLEYLEHCRVLVKGGRVVFLQPDRQGKVSNYWNIPIANTTVVLMGTGTSITQRAVAMLCEAGVMVGFCGTGGTPLYAGTEVEWISPQSEYRPTEYVQAWLGFWFDDAKRLQAAKTLQHRRLDYLLSKWPAQPRLANHQIFVDDRLISSSIKTARRDIDRGETTTDLLTAEARLTKALYKYVARSTGHQDFTRDPQQPDPANRFLTHGNYLAYGQAASCLWCLGIPHGFAVMHGKTRRGALVFDIADIVKDALVLPLAFIAAAEGWDDQTFRQACVETLTQHESMQQMFESVKAVIDQMGSSS